MDTATAQNIHGLALGLIAIERERQVKEKGYDHHHDDDHGNEELAIAAAFYLLPSWLNLDICYPNSSNGLEIKPLREFVAVHTFDVDAGSDNPMESRAELDTRIEVLTKGVALGLAELERLMRGRQHAFQTDEEDHR